MEKKITPKAGQVWSFRDVTCKLARKRGDISPVFANSECWEDTQGTVWDIPGQGASTMTLVRDVEEKPAEPYTPMAGVVTVNGRATNTLRTPQPGDVWRWRDNEFKVTRRHEGGTGWRFGELTYDWFTDEEFLDPRMTFVRSGDAPAVEGKPAVASQPFSRERLRDRVLKTLHECPFRERLVAEKMAEINASYQESERERRHIEAIKAAMTAPMATWQRTPFVSGWNRRVPK